MGNTDKSCKFSDTTGFGLELKTPANIYWQILYPGIKSNTNPTLNKSQWVVKAWTEPVRHSKHGSQDMEKGTGGNLGSTGTIPQCWRGFSACRTYFIPIQKGLADDVFTDICWWSQAVQSVEQFHTGNVVLPSLLVQLIPEHTGNSLGKKNNISINN